MKRINTPTATQDHKFRDGDRTTGLKATQFSAEWCNQVQEELCNLVKKWTGAEPTGLNDHELADSFNYAKGVELYSVQAGGTLDLSAGREKLAIVFVVKRNDSDSLTITGIADNGNLKGLLVVPVKGPFDLSIILSGLNYAFTLQGDTSCLLSIGRTGGQVTITYDVSRFLIPVPQKVIYAQYGAAKYSDVLSALNNGWPVYTKITVDSKEKILFLNRKETNKLVFASSSENGVYYIAELTYSDEWSNKVVEPLLIVDSNTSYNDVATAVAEGRLLMFKGVFAQGGNVKYLPLTEVAAGNTSTYVFNLVERDGLICRAECTLVGGETSWSKSMRNCLVKSDGDVDLTGNDYSDFPDNVTLTIANKGSDAINVTYKMDSNNNPVRLNYGPGRFYSFVRFGGNWYYG